MYWVFGRSFLGWRTANLAGAPIVPPLNFAGAPFKTLEQSEGQKCTNFHFSKVIYELLWSFFPKYANKTTVLQYNFIHKISNCA